MRHANWLTAEALICFGPHALYLLTGIVLVPHQLRLAVMDQALEPWYAIYYYLGVACLLTVVTTLLSWLRRGSATRRSRRMTGLMLVLGLPALAIGPVGIYAIGGYDNLSGWVVVVFTALPGLCLAHLCYAARRTLS